MATKKTADCLGIRNKRERKNKVKMKECKPPILYPKQKKKPQTNNNTNKKAEDT
jgi:hypothetical protein